MDNRRDEVLAVAALFFFLAWITVGLRCYVRLSMTKTFGVDDCYMVAALVRSGTCMVEAHTDSMAQGVFTVYLAFQTTAALYGTGRHRQDLSDHDARTALMVSPTLDEETFSFIAKTSVLVPM